MPLSFLELLQKYEPLTITGFCKHSYFWLTAPTQTIVFENPNFIHSENDVAIYCVHGTADRCGAFSLIANRILKNLPTNISKIYLVSFQNCSLNLRIEDYATQLAKIIQANGHKKVIVWGHSRGGLIGSWFAEYLAQAIAVDVLGVSPICSPLFGSNFARVPLSWLAVSISQMSPESPLLKELREKIISSTIPYLYFSATYDGLVAPNAARIENHGEACELPHTHISIMSSNKLVAQLLIFLQTCLIKNKLQADCKEDDIKSVRIGFNRD